MRNLVYYIGMSIDGVIAGPQGEVDFFPVGGPATASAYAAWMNERYPETVPTGMRAAAGIADAPNRRFDAVVLGMGTYRPALDHGVTSPYAHLRQYVVSSTLGSAVDPAVEVIGSDPAARIRELKKQDGGDIWLCGGGELAASLLPEIDEMIIKSYPVVAGAGARVFSGAFDPAYFVPENRETFDNGVIVTWFRRRLPSH